MKADPWREAVRAAAYVPAHEHVLPEPLAARWVATNRRTLVEVAQSWQRPQALQTGPAPEFTGARGSTQCERASYASCLPANFTPDRSALLAVEAARVNAVTPLLCGAR